MTSKGTTCILTAALFGEDTNIVQCILCFWGHEEGLEGTPSWAFRDIPYCSRGAQQAQQLQRLCRSCASLCPCNVYVPIYLLHWSLVIVCCISLKHSHQAELAQKIWVHKGSRSTTDGFVEVSLYLIFETVSLWHECPAHEISDHNTFRTCCQSPTAVASIC